MNTCVTTMDKTRASTRARSYSTLLTAITAMIA